MITDKKAIAQQISAALLGGLFLFSGSLKLQNPDQLFFSLLEAQIISANAAYYLSRTLPYLELALGIVGIIAAILPARHFLSRLLCLLFGLCAAFLLMIFNLYLFIAWQRGLLIDCACFGPLGANWGIGTSLVRNVFLFLWALFISIGLPTKKKSTPSP
ncbi:MAG: MauE/DoxX family redox-associated membrane protein [Chthoniobacterales bacterium]